MVNRVEPFVNGIGQPRQGFMADAFGEQTETVFMSDAAELQS